MAVLKVEDKDLNSFLDKLSGVINFNKDLPLNVFVGGGFLFWFFERPLLCFFEIFSGLVSNSVSSFKSDVIVKFSGSERLGNSCFSFDGSEIEKDARWLSKKFESFFFAIYNEVILPLRPHSFNTLIISQVSLLN